MTDALFTGIFFKMGNDFRLCDQLFKDVEAIEKINMTIQNCF